MSVKKSNKKPKKAKTATSAKPSKSKLEANSMTGFGKASGSFSGIQIDIEVRTLNNRFLDLNLKLPRGYAAFEQEIRNSVSGKLSRGRVDLAVSRSQTETAQSEPKFNASVFNGLSAFYTKLAKRQGVFDKEFQQRLIFELLAKRDVLSFEEEVLPNPKEKASLLVLINKALDNLVQMRAEEGQRLAKDLDGRIDVLQQIHTDLKSQSEKSPEEIRKKLLRRISALEEDIDIDRQRLSTEIALLADRADVTEELVRLESHLFEARACLRTPQQGKKLEFITQELGREFNTIGSKSSDVAISTLVVEAKSQLEKIKEQAANLE